MQLAQKQPAHWAGCTNVGGTPDVVWDYLGLSLAAKHSKNLGELSCDKGDTDATGFDVE